MIILTKKNWANFSHLTRLSSPQSLCYTYSKMKIGIFTDTYYPSTDGVTTSLSQYKRSLEQLGHEVYVFAPKYPGYHDQEKNIIRLKAFDVILADKHRSVLIYPGLVKSLQGINLDIVHSQSLLGMGLVADMIAKDKQIPHIHTVHTLYPELADHYPAVLSASLVMAALIYPLYFKTKIPTIKQPISQSSSKVFLKRQSWKIMLLFCNSTNAIIVPSQHLLDKMVTRGLKRKLSSCQTQSTTTSTTTPHFRVSNMMTSHSSS